MPAAAAVFVTGAASFGAAVSIGIGTAIAYAAVYIAVSAAISYAFAAITKALTTSGADLSNEASARQTVVRSASEPRRLIYGVVKVAGPLVFATTSGVDNSFLHLVIAIAGSEITAIDEIWFDDTMLPVGSGVGDVTTGKYAGVARVLSHLGQAGQTVDTFLQTDVGTGLWDSTHVLSDTAYLYVRLKWNQTVFPSGIPRIAAVVRGRKIYDPRTALTAYSTNSALVVRDYLRHANGLRCVAADIDDPTFITAAGICDESVTINPTGAQVRYDCNGSIPLDMPHKTAVDQLLTSCAGYLVYSQGVYRIYAGAYRSPTVTLDEDNMSGPISISPRIPRADLFNSVRGQFVNPNASWQAVDFPPVKNATYQTEDGGEQIFADLALPFTTNAARAQRLAKIMLEKSRQPISVVFQGNLTCFKVQPLDTVMLTIARLGWVSKVFLCVGWTFAETGQVILALQEEASSVYAWAGGSETLIDTAPATNLPNPLTVAAPTSFVVTSSNEFLVEGNGQVTTRLKLTWVAPVDTYVTTSGRIEVQYRRDPDTNWLTAPPAPGNATVTWLAPIQPGGAYDIQIRAINSLEIASAWVVASNHVAAAPTFSDNSDNLIPNPNSEVGTPALNVIPDGFGLITDAANAYAGQWVRRFTATATTQAALLSSKIAATAGDQYYFEAFLKGTTAHVGVVQVRIYYYDAAGVVMSAAGKTHIPTTTYARVGVVGTVPIAAVSVSAVVEYGGTGDTGKNLYVDNMYMRRMVNGSIIMDDSVSDAQLTNGFNTDNMIPNANSELGAAAIGLNPEGNGLVNDSVNSLAGAWCRRTTIPAASFGTIALTGYIPCSPGDAFSFEGFLKASAALVTAGAYLTIEFTDTNKLNPVSLTSTNVLLGTSYQKLSVQAATPAGSVFLRVYFSSNNSGGTNTGKILYGDSFVLKRLVTGGLDGNAYSDNLVTNGSFESGPQDAFLANAATASGGSFSVVQPGDAPEGNSCLRLAATVAGSGFSVGLRAFPVTPTDTYIVRCKIRSSNSTGSVYVQVYPSTARPPTGFLENSITSVPSAGADTASNAEVITLLNNSPKSLYLSWTSLEFIYTPAANVRWAALAFSNWTGATGTLDVDEVEVRRQIGTQHVEDNAITQPFAASTLATVDIRHPNLGWGPSSTGLGYTEGVAMSGSVVSTGGQILVSCECFVNTLAAAGISYTDAAIRRASPSVNVTSITVVSGNSFNVVTASPHGLTSADVTTGSGGLGTAVHFFGNTSGFILNSTSDLLRYTFVSSVTSTTAFSIGTVTTSPFTAPTAGTVWTGGTLVKSIGLTSLFINPYTLLKTPAGATYSAAASFSALDAPPLGTWRYYCLVGTANGLTPTTATVSQRLITILGLSK